MCAPRPQAADGEAERALLLAQCRAELEAEEGRLSAARAVRKLCWASKTIKRNTRLRRQGERRKLGERLAAKRAEAEERHVALVAAVTVDPAAPPAVQQMVAERRAQLEAHLAAVRLSGPLSMAGAAWRIKAAAPSS